MVGTKGRNVKAKSGLNRSILNQGRFEFRLQLEYKQAWAGGQVLAVNPRNTRRTCPCCNHVAKENRLTQAKFECVECGYAENADLVGAINILAAGHAVLACGVTVQQDRTVKHEPAESIRKSSRESVDPRSLGRGGCQLLLSLYNLFSNVFPLVILSSLLPTESANDANLSSGRGWVLNSKATLLSLGFVCPNICSTSVKPNGS